MYRIIFTKMLGPDKLNINGDFQGLQGRKFLLKKGVDAETIIKTQRKSHYHYLTLKYCCLIHREILDRSLLYIAYCPIILCLLITMLHSKKFSTLSYFLVVIWSDILLGRFHYDRPCMIFVTRSVKRGSHLSDKWLQSFFQSGSTTPAQYVQTSNTESIITAWHCNVCVFKKLIYL